MIEVTFWGVRGSAPAPGRHTNRYGGNTSCAVVESPGRDPLVLDLGTGLHAWGETFPGPVRARALVTHLHWDHVQGLPYFLPLDRSGTCLEILGPSPRDLVPALGPPLFPVCLADRAGEVRFVDVDNEQLDVGGMRVTVRPVPHFGRTNGYRIEVDGLCIAYVSDHQAPPALDRVADPVLELADGADLLIHDAQYTDDEFRDRSGWGHSTFDYAVLVAREAGARRLALYHHDPGRTDDDLDRQVELARRTAERLGVPEVLAAAEGLTLRLGA